MAWKMKLQQAPRRRYTAREIAAEVGVSVGEVMEALKAVGEFVGSDRHRTIEEPVKREVCEQLGVDYKTPTEHTPTPWRREDQGGPGRARRHPGRPQSARPKDSGTTTVASPDRSVGIGDPSEDASAAMEDFAWSYCGFSATERDAWCVYLRPGQVKEAARLRDAGFIPDDLAVNVSGWTVAKRLRSGESLAEVKRLLDRHRFAG